MLFKIYYLVIWGSWPIDGEIMGFRAKIVTKLDEMQKIFPKTQLICNISWEI